MRRNPNDPIDRGGGGTRGVLGALVVMAALASTGCSSSVRVSDPPRTATEQFLLSAAATRAVEQLSVDALRGRRVYIETRYFASTDQPFVLGELRAKMMLTGVELVPSSDDAEIVVEVRTGGVGIDRSDMLVGLPSILLNTGTTGDGEATIPLATPELVLVKNIKQHGVASIAFIAYWKETGEVVATSGPFIGRTHREDWWFLGFGRNTIGDIPPVERAE